MMIMGVISIVISLISATVSVVSLVMSWRAHVTRIKIDLVGLQVVENSLQVAPTNLLGLAAIRVFNASSFDVTISEVGIRVADPSLEDLIPTPALTLENGPLPVRLAARAACNVPMNGRNAYHLADRKIVTVFARTDSGKEFRISRSKLAVFDVLHETRLSNAKKAKRVLLKPPTPKSEEA